MAEPGFELLFQNLASVGFFEFFLPLILFLAIYFGLMKTTEVIGDDDAVIGVASMAAAFITVFGIYTFVPFSFFPQFFGIVATVLVTVLALVLLMGMAGVDLPEESRWIQLGTVGGGILVAVLAIPAVFLAFFGDAGGAITLTEEMQSWIVTLALMGVMAATVFWLVQNGE